MHYCTAWSTWTLLPFSAWCWGKQLHWKRMGWTSCWIQWGLGCATVHLCSGVAPKPLWQQPSPAVVGHHCSLQGNPDSEPYSWRIHTCCSLFSNLLPRAIWIPLWDALSDSPTSWGRPLYHQGNLYCTLSIAQELSLIHMRMQTDWY